MQPRPYAKLLSSIVVAVCFADITLFAHPPEAESDRIPSKIVCRDELATSRRDQLIQKLRVITGWSDLKFNSLGALQPGANDAVSGSSGARELLAKALNGDKVIVLEDASKRDDVVFCRVVPGRWKSKGSQAPPAFVVQIDFADFEYVMGDQAALEAFDVGWALLHELDHVVNDSDDANSSGDSGTCEDHINEMRREMNLPRRTEYFFTLFPLENKSGFTTRFVRLAFEKEDELTNKRRHYWLVWDASLVGGVYMQSRVASLTR